MSDCGVTFDMNKAAPKRSMDKDSSGSKKLKFAVGNDEPTDAYLNGTESRNGIKIVGTERVQKKGRNLQFLKANKLPWGMLLETTHMCAWWISNGGKDQLQLLGGIYDLNVNTWIGTRKWRSFPLISRKAVFLIYEKDWTT